MGKASLKKVSEEFIEGTAKKRKKQKRKKAEKTKKQKNVKMKRDTFFLPEDIHKILWHHRVDTGKSISKIVTELVRTHIK